MGRSWSRLVRQLPRTVRGALAALAVPALLVAGLTAPAQAAPAVHTWSLSDGFEVGATGSWTFGGVPSCVNCGYVSDDPWQARSGTRWASIEARASDSWFSVGRTVRLAPPTTSASCAARMYVKVAAGTVNVEVINPATWTYLAVSTVGVGGDYQRVTTGIWRATTPADVVVRASVVRAGSPPTSAFANVDDVSVTCTYF